MRVWPVFFFGTGAPKVFDALARGVGRVEKSAGPVGAFWPSLTSRDAIVTMWVSSPSVSSFFFTFHQSWNLEVSPKIAARPGPTWPGLKRTVPQQPIKNKIESVTLPSHSARSV